MTRLTHGTLIAVWLVIGLNLLLAFGAIGVFTRMAPAIRIILEQNDRSLAASEVMLAALARRTDSGPDRVLREERFAEALQVASGNVTEPQEPAILLEIEQRHRAAFSGEPEAINATIDAIEQLASVNRAAMMRADQRAEQLGRAGGWSVAIMAAIAFVVSLGLLRGLRMRVIAPLEEIHDAVTGFVAGDEQRRCSISVGNRELRAVCNGINTVLDRTDASRAARAEQVGSDLSGW